jgi:hypothetical protein
MSEWLELELADSLAPVQAPDKLWNLVQQPRPMAIARRRPVRTVLLLAAAAMASVWVAAAWRPEARGAQPSTVRASSAESHFACRSCHAD